RGQRLERCPVAVHGKDRVAHDEPAAAAWGGGERGLQGLYVAVGIDLDAGPREPAPVDDARVVEGIAVDVVAAADERRDRAHVRRELRVEDSHAAVMPGASALVNLERSHG